MTNNLVGKKFNYLTVIEFAEVDKFGNKLWLCKCDCGKTKIIRGNHLKTHGTKSCGCWNDKNRKEMHLKHCQTKTSTYKIWSHIKDRCLNPKNKSYKNYGGRGITVCDRWKDSFENFLQDMGKCPKGMTIDRINNNLGYYPNNCRWANQKTQQRNRRNNRIIKFNDTEKTLSEWADDLGMNQDTLGFRINSNKWTLERALTQGLKKRTTKCKS